MFVLDEDPVIAARLNCDIHVNKIILEAASCMCAAHWEHGFPLLEYAPLPLIKGQYRGKTHHNNHVTKWVRNCTGNYEWTAIHAIELCEEYSRRYHIRTGLHRRHASEEIVLWLAKHRPYGLVHAPRTTFTQAIAEECYHQDTVAAYWTYYAACKWHLTTWKHTATPNWYVALESMRLKGATIGELLDCAVEMRKCGLSSLEAANAA